MSLIILQANKLATLQRIIDPQVIYDGWTNLLAPSIILFCGGYVHVPLYKIMQLKALKWI